MVGEIENESNMGYGVKLDQVIKFSDWVYITGWEDKAKSPGFIRNLCQL